jgi:hypothetical protein
MICHSQFAEWWEEQVKAYELLDIDERKPLLLEDSRYAAGSLFEEQVLC